MNSLPCDIVILPNDELANKAISASQKLAPLGGLFTLEIGKYFPHASLFMLQLKEDDLENVKSLLAEIASKTSALNLKASNYEQKEAYVDVEYARNEQTASLQQQVVATLNPIRDGMREKDKARMLEATGLALENFQNYGYKYVGELFRPHITFTRFSETQPEAKSLLPELSTFNGSFTKLGLFEMGDNGTCVRKIAEFDLRKNLQL